MKENTFLSTYQIRVRNKRAKEEQLLNLFNGADDLLPIMNAFFRDIIATPRKIGNDEERNTQLVFTMQHPPSIIVKDRVIYGYIETGIIGQDIRVKDHIENVDVFKGSRDKHGLYKSMFFYCKMPLNKKRGYLILQKRAKYGVKSAFTNLMKYWIRDNGFHDTYFDVNAVYNGELFNHMVRLGSLKKVNFVVNYIPETSEDYFNNNEEPSRTKGSLTTTVKSNSSLSTSWKDFALRQYLKKGKNTLVEINGEDKEYDEIEFEVEINGKKKTFFAKNKHRTLPDMDVSGELMYDVDGEPLLDSMLKCCERIVKDTFEFDVNV